MAGVNPIRKQRGLLAWSVVTGHRVRVNRYWCAVCPECGERILRARRSHRDLTTRKQAKDALHVHRKHEHAEPGGDRSELDAEAARRSP